MKKILCVILVISLMCSFPFSAHAATVDAALTLDEIYANAYETAITTDVGVITDDISAYAFILQNKSAVSIVNNQVVLDASCLVLDEIIIVQDFISRLNVLLEDDAIEIDADFRLSVKPAPILEPAHARVAVFDLMEMARENAATLKREYDNAVFGTATITAGLYFTERVKSGGAWDLKSYLGANTTYYIPDLRVYMTGETIGNFHYGYVGSAVFSPSTLKTAAGLYQIISGTSNWSFWDSYFDDPADTEDIQWGIDVYNDEH